MRLIGCRSIGCAPCPCRYGHTSARWSEYEAASAGQGLVARGACGSGRASPHLRLWAGARPSQSHGYSAGQDCTGSWEHHRSAHRPDGRHLGHKLYRLAALRHKPSARSVRVADSPVHRPSRRTTRRSHARRSAWPLLMGGAHGAPAASAGSCSAGRAREKGRLCAQGRPSGPARPAEIARTLNRYGAATSGPNNPRKGNL